MFEGPEGEEGSEVGLVLHGQELGQGGMLEVPKLAGQVQMLQDLAAFVTCGDIVKIWR